MAYRHNEVMPHKYGRDGPVPHNYGHKGYPPESPSEGSRRNVGGDMWGRRWFSPYAMNPIHRTLLLNNSRSSIRSHSSESIESMEEEKESKRRRIRNFVRVVGLLAVVGVVGCLALSVVFSRKNDKKQSLHIYSELTWNEEYRNEYFDSSSEVYKTFVGKVKTAMYNTLASENTFKGFDVISLRPGSVIITGIFYFLGDKENALSALKSLTRNPSEDLKISQNPTFLVIDSNITSIAQECNKQRGYHLTQEGECEACPIGSYGITASTTSGVCITCSACQPCPTNRTTMSAASYTSNACIELAEFSVDIRYTGTFREEYRNKNSERYLSTIASLKEEISDHLSESSLNIAVILLRKSETDVIATVRITIASSQESVKTTLDDVMEKLRTLKVSNGKATTTTPLGSVYTSAEGKSCEAGYKKVGDQCSPCQFGWYSTSPNSCEQCPEGYMSNGVGSSECTERNECLSIRCENGGTCEDLLNDFSCECQPGFTGKKCETDIDECASSPCQSGGTCEDRVNGYICKCTPDKAGAMCERDKTACDDPHCLNMGTCSDDGTLNNYDCTCVPGYTGKDCEIDIDECAPNPCQNGGACTDGVNMFSCACAKGYTGDSCETNIDDCDPNPCEHGTCADEVSGFSCTCDPGFSGNTCSDNDDDCFGVNCHYGSCQDLVNDYKCNCEAGYEGKNCNQDIDECTTTDHGCEHNCLNTAGSYVCNCNEGYALNSDGKTCREMDYCEKYAPCGKYFGTCIPEGLTGYKCKCSYCTCAPTVKLNATCHPDTLPCPPNISGAAIAPHDCGKYILCASGSIANVLPCGENLIYDGNSDQRLGKCVRQNEAPYPNTCETIIRENL